jgi:hypothetical protein
VLNVEGGSTGHPAVSACPLCGSATAGAPSRCPSCGLFLAVADRSHDAFGGRTVWLLAAGLAAVYLLMLLVVSLAR